MGAMLGLLAAAAAILGAEALVRKIDREISEQGKAPSDESSRSETTLPAAYPAGNGMVPGALGDVTPPVAEPERAAKSAAEPHRAERPGDGSKLAAVPGGTPGGR